MREINKLWNMIWKKKNNISISKIESHSAKELLRDLELTRDKKKRVMTYIEGIKSEEEFSRQYSKLSKDDAIYLEKLSAQVKEIEEKKINLKGRLVKNNAALAKISEYEDDIPEMMIQMREMENRKKETEAHIFYLKEEQVELYEERDTLIRGHKLLKGFIAAIISGIIISLFVSFALLQILQENITLIFTAICFVLVALVIGVVMFNDFINKALITNEKLQKKVVYYLNKSKLRLFNQTKFLQYSYNKLGVDSTAKLEMYYNRYLKNKNNEKIYLRMNEMLSEIEEDMIAYLKNKDIDIEYIENFSDWILTPKKLNQIKQISKDYQKAKEQLLGLEKYESQLLKEIEVIKESAEVDEEMLNQLIAVC